MNRAEIILLKMSSNWTACKKILCIRPDNMGDVLMSSPAIRALKQSLNCHITLLTSSMGKGIASRIPEIDEIIQFDLPWLKNGSTFDLTAFYAVIESLRSGNYDGAVIFTVYSQNPLPSAMIAFMAGIPRRLAYCRENPYELITDWIPEKEPYSFIRHQVQRDLDLVESIGAVTEDTRLSVEIHHDKWEALKIKLAHEGLNINQPWVLLHAGVSETKREYPARQWIILAKNIINELNHQVVFTGGASETELTARLATESGAGAFNMGGSLSLDEFILLIKMSPLVISVNTGTIHIAAATGTPVIVLYALTNPQHAPWKSTGKVFPFPVPVHLQSRNEVIRHVNKKMKGYNKTVKMSEVLAAVRDLLSGTANREPYVIPDLIPFSKLSEELL